MMKWRRGEWEEGRGREDGTEEGVGERRGGRRGAKRGTNNLSRDLYPEFVMEACFGGGSTCPYYVSPVQFWCQVANAFRTDQPAPLGVIL